MKGLMGYMNNKNAPKGSAKAPYMPSSDQEVLMNALQSLSQNENAGGLGQGLAGFAYAMQAGKRGSDLQQKEMDRKEALASVFDKLSGGNVNASIGALGDAARSGLSPEDIARFGEIIKPATQAKTTFDANGNPVFTNTSSAISGNMMDAPESRQMFKTQEDVLNNQAMRQQAQQGLGLRGQELGLQREKMNFDKNQGRAPVGYRFTPEGGLVPIPGGPADLKAQAAAQGKVLPNTVLKEIATNQGALNKIDAALQMADKNKSAFGAHNYVPGVDRFTNDQDALAARASIADVGSQVIHDRSGAAVTISEMPRLAPFIPQATDTPQQVKVKLNQLRKGIEEVTNGYLTTFEAQGYNVNNLGGKKDDAPKENTAPMQGARQAADGNFYVPDPQRPGKYLQVMQ